MSAFAAWVPVLGVPSLFLAGLASSAHCALMCGALQARSGRAFDGASAAGRLAAYATLGAVAGAAGSSLLWAARWTDEGHHLRLLLLPLLVLLLVRSARAHARAPCCASTRIPAEAGIGARLLAGYAGTLLPCPLLYLMAGYAAMAGGAAQGAALLFAFGLGSAPGVHGGAWMMARAARGVAGPWLAAGAAVAASLAALLVVPDAASWCIP